MWTRISKSEVYNNDEIQQQHNHFERETLDKHASNKVGNINYDAHYKPHGRMLVQWEKYYNGIR